METSKYYTPTVDEFHIGFEYEYKHAENAWVSYTYDEHSDLDYIDGGKIVDGLREDIEEGLIRVKYLDEGDFKSLGFIKTKDFSDSTIFQHFTDYDKYLWEVELYDHNEIWVERFEKSGGGDYNSEYIFKGTIKNISELKTLLKQLRIYETNKITNRRNNNTPHEK